MNITIQQPGSLCSACGKGTLEIKTSKYGVFLGCNRFPKCAGKCNYDMDLNKIATSLLKKKKPRRAKRKNKLYSRTMKQLKDSKINDLSWIK